MEDKELKRRLKRIPDIDKNGDPIYKIDSVKTTPVRKIEPNKKSDRRK